MSEPLHTCEGEECFGHVRPEDEGLTECDHDAPLVCSKCLEVVES